MCVLQKSINVPPPSDFESFGPSELFKFFFQLGRWTEESFSDEFQTFTCGKLVSTVTINKWKNKDVIPARYSGPLLKMVENAVAQDLSAEWVRAFETVWAHQSSGRPLKKQEADSSRFSNKTYDQHKKWIEQLYKFSGPENTAPPAALYVPIQLHDVSEDILEPLDIEDAFDKAGQSDRVFISGGPGAGKSMAALHLAYILSQNDLFSIYLRGRNLSNIDIDITDPRQQVTDSFSFSSFLKHFRASSFQTACLVLDGIDEIGHTSQNSFGSLSHILSALRSEQSACVAHGKTLHIIVFGRDAHVRAAIEQSSTRNFRHFELLALDGSYRGRENTSNGLQGEDLRELWWTKYLAVTQGLSDPSLPDFLTTEYDDFSEFGTDPLLATLICEAAFGKVDNSDIRELPHERVNALTFSSNKNLIYHNITEKITTSRRPKIDSRLALSVLQQIAISSWQRGNSRSIDLEAVYHDIREEGLKSAFQALNLSDHSRNTPPNSLMTTFYYRLSDDKKENSKSAFEFTHKTFSEYLVSTRLFDAFVELISTFDNNVEFERSLERWTHISHSGCHTPSLGEFCQKEAALRYNDLSNLDWDMALTIIKHHMNGSQFKEPEFASLEHIRNSVSLLFFIWSCLNLERQKRSGDKFHLPKNKKAFTVRDLKSIQCLNALDFKTGNRLEPILLRQTFLTQSLSGLKLGSSDMSQLSFSLGHMENVNCEDTSFAMTHWSHVKTSSTEFTQCTFQQAIFHHWRLFNTRFDHCFFQGSRFQGVNFSKCHFNQTFFSQCHFFEVNFSASHWIDVVFDRCVFTGCSFPSQPSDTSTGLEFRHCTVLNEDEITTNPLQEHKFTKILGSLL